MHPMVQECAQESLSYTFLVSSILLFLCPSCVMETKMIYGYVDEK